VYDTNVFCRRERLPDVAAIAEAFRSAGTTLAFPAGFELRSWRGGWVPMIVDGVESGAEIRISPIEEKEVKGYRVRLARSSSPPDDYLTLLINNDSTVTISIHSDGDAGFVRSLAIVIARLSGGGFMDPQTGEIVPTA
jgi:hypothetical protein